MRPQRPSLCDQRAVWQNVWLSSRPGRHLKAGGRIASLLKHTPFEFEVSDRAAGPERDGGRGSRTAPPPPWPVQWVVFVSPWV